MNYIFYQTKTQFENAGDVLINKALIENLRSFGKVQCNCSSGISDEFINELGINNDEKIVIRNGFQYAVSILKKAIKSKMVGDKVYIVSGLGHQWGGNFKSYIKNIFAGCIFSIYRLFGIKIIKIGMSIGPITRWQGITEKFRSNFINYYYVRDTKSFDLCKKIGINKVKICPDMSWLYLNNLDKKINETNLVSVSLRESVLDEKDDKYVGKMFEKCDIILNTLEKTVLNMKVIFYYQVGRDKTFCEKAYNYFKEKYNCEFLPKQIFLSSAETIYKNTAYNISNRMHSLLLSYKYGAIPIALIDTENHVKIAQTLKDNYLDDFIVDVYSDNKSRIKDIVNKKEDMFERLIKTEKENSTKIINILSSIFDN